MKLHNFSSSNLPNFSTSQHRLVLGTAQLGTNYGIANRTGQPDFKTAESIVKTAWDFGIREFDTAPGYGESEYVLGKVLESSGMNNEARIISKFHPDLDHLNQGDMRQAIEMTLSHLKIPKLYGIMLHREDLLDLWDKGLGEILTGFIRSGLVKHLGVSVYSPDKAIHALRTEGLSIVQLPSNLLDRRFERSGVFQLAGEMEKQIYVRSVFLQGLLLMDSTDLPENMQFALSVLKRFEKLSQETGVSKQDISLGYVMHAYPEAKIVIGVETPEQLKDNLKSWKAGLHPGFMEQAREEFESVEDRILNPALWSHHDFSIVKTPSK